MVSEIKREILDWNILKFKILVVIKNSIFGQQSLIISIFLTLKDQYEVLIYLPAQLDEVWLSDKSRNEYTIMLKNA